MNIKISLLHRIFSFPFSLQPKLLFLLLLIFAFSLEPSALSPVYAASKGNPPIAHWRFDESGGPTAYDESANNNDGTLNAGAGGTNTAVGQMWTRQGKIGSAGEFDGTDDYVNCGNNASLDITNAITLEAWIYANALGGEQFIVSKEQQKYTLEVYHSNKFVFSLSTGAGIDYLDSITTAQTGRWYHVVGTYDKDGGANNKKIYINGVLDTQESQTGAIETSVTNFFIGTYQVAGSYKWNGLIDDVRIYNYARSADQILVDYNAGTAVYSGAGTDPNEGNPPVGYWKFDENTGTTAYDRSGNGNNGTITGATYVAGKYGLALNFNGTSNSVNIGTTVLNNRTTGTISMWINPRSAAANGGQPWLNTTLFSNDNIYLGIQILSSYKIRAYYWDTTASPKNIDSVNPVPLNSWSFITYSWDGSGSKVYINGSLETSSALTWTNVHSGHVNQGNYLGSTNGGSYWFDGLIDDVRIYNYVRTPAQIAYDYNKGKPVAHYKFDEGGGAISHNEYSLPSVTPHRYWRFVQTAILTSHAPRTCELRWTDLLGNARTPDSYTHGGTFSYSEELWNTSFDSATNTTDTGWIAGNTGYITADFGASGCAMMKFEAYGSYTGSARGATWDIQYSDDNSNWVTVKTWNFQTTDNGGGLGVGNYAGWYGIAWHTHGTLVGDTKFVDGKIGKALTFDGTGDKIETPYSSDFDCTSGVTTEAWIKTASTGSGDVIFSKYGASGSGQSYMLILNGDNVAPNKVTFYCNGWLPSNSSVNDNAWHHVAATSNGSTWAIYIDGKLDNSGSGGAISTSNSTASIGGPNSNGWGSYFNGKIDDVRIYNYVRSADQVLQDYNAGMSSHAGVSTGVADPWGGALPVGHWKLDENTGVLAKDASGNGNNGTLTNGPTWAQGKVGSALSFDGTNDYVSLPAFSNPSSVTDYSISFWFYMNAHNPAGRTYLYDFRGNGSVVDETAPLFLIDNSGGLGTLDAFTGIELISSAISVLTQWHHVTVTRTSGTTKIYLDSLLVKEGDAGAGGNLGVAKRLGDYAAQNTPGGNYWLNGIIDDIKIYNYARTQAQIAWDYNKGKPVGHWRFDESSGTTCYDDSGNNNGTATIGGTGTQTTIAAARTNGATGKYGKCMSFDGTDDYVQLPSASNLQIVNNSFTAEAWIKLSALDNNDKTIFGTDEAVANAGLHLVIRNQKPYMGFFANDTTGNTTLSTGVWYHLTWVYTQSSGEQRIYVNGVSDAATTGHATFQGTGIVRIGRWAGSYYFPGLIDDVRIYNYARTADQILQDYNQGLAAKMGE